MANWLERAIERGESGSLANDCFVQKRQQSLALLKEQVWPGRKVEAWKYTSLYPLQDKSFALEGSAAANDSATFMIDGLESLDLIFINGQLQNLPTDLPQGLSITRASAAAESWVVEGYAAIKPERHLFGLVNDVLPLTCFDHSHVRYCRIL